MLSDTKKTIGHLELKQPTEGFIDNKQKVLYPIHSGLYFTLTITMNESKVEEKKERINPLLNELKEELSTLNEICRIKINY